MKMKHWIIRKLGGHVLDHKEKELLYPLWQVRTQTSRIGIKDRELEKILAAGLSCEYSLTPLGEEQLSKAQRKPSKVPFIRIPEKPYERKENSKLQGEFIMPQTNIKVRTTPMKIIDF